MLIKWLGHSSFLINTSGKNIYVDPYSGEYSEKADFILITHSHRDHCASDKIEAVRRDDTLIVTTSECASGLKGNVVSMSPGDVREIDGVKVEAVEAYNYKRFRSPGVPYHPKGFGIGYIITAEGKTMYFAGDTDLIPEMDRLKSKNIDIALLPSGGTYTMDNLEAAEAALVIKPKVVIPIHRWDTDPVEFKRSVEAKSEIKVLMLKPGEVFTPQ